MSYDKCINSEQYWTVRIRAFPPEKRRAIERIANTKRLSIGSYLGNLLDEEIRKADAQEVRP